MLKATMSTKNTLSYARSKEVQGISCSRRIFWMESSSHQDQHETLPCCYAATHLPELLWCATHVWIHRLLLSTCGYHGPVPGKPHQTIGIGRWHFDINLHCSRSWSKSFAYLWRCIDVRHQHPCWWTGFHHANACRWHSSGVCLLFLGFCVCQFVGSDRSVTPDKMTPYLRVVDANVSVGWISLMETSSPELRAKTTSIAVTIQYCTSILFVSSPILSLVKSSLETDCVPRAIPSP
jgi:hypothetical protein